MTAAMQRGLLQQKNTLQDIRSKLLQASPAISIQRSMGQLAALRQRIAAAGDVAVSTTEHRIALLGRALHAVSPLATLDRGYAIVTNEQDGRVLLTAGEIAKGDDIRARLSAGELVATVTEVITDD
jgi:exodeoxyribonuclease VII large subunit